MLFFSRKPGCYPPWRATMFRSLPAGTNSTIVPLNTPMMAFTHFLVFTKSSAVEQTTPQKNELRTLLSLRTTGLLHSNRTLQSHNV